MKDEKIKQVLRENLKYPEDVEFNNRIIQKLEVDEPQKQPSVLFNEISIVKWFLMVSVFVLFFYLFQEVKRQDDR